MTPTITHLPVRRRADCPNPQHLSAPNPAGTSADPRTAEALRAGTTRALYLFPDDAHPLADLAAREMAPRRLERAFILGVLTGSAATLTVALLSLLLRTF